MRSVNWPLVLLVVYGSLVALGAFLFVFLHATGVLSFRPEEAVAFWMLCLGVGILPLGSWILLHVWIYVDAQHRGMNGPLWAVLSFCLSIVGPILYLLLRQPLHEACPVCGRCGGVLQSGWRVCPACGTPTTAEPAALEPDGPPAF